MLRGAIGEAHTQATWACQGDIPAQAPDLSGVPSPAV